MRLFLEVLVFDASRHFVLWFTNAFYPAVIGRKPASTCTFRPWGVSKDRYTILGCCYECAIALIGHEFRRTDRSGCQTVLLTPADGCSFCSHSSSLFACARILAYDAQHPLVYKVSSAWDSLTAESDEGIGVRELRRLDPSFSVEDWKRDIQELFLPEFMSAFLRVRKEEDRLLLYSTSFFFKTCIKRNMERLGPYLRRGTQRDMSSISCRPLFFFFVPSLPPTPQYP